MQEIDDSQQQPQQAPIEQQSAPQTPQKRQVPDGFVVMQKGDKKKLVPIDRVNSALQWGATIVDAGKNQIPQMGGPQGGMPGFDPRYGLPPQAMQMLTQALIRGPQQQQLESQRASEKAASDIIPVTDADKSDWEKVYNQEMPDVISNTGLHRQQQKELSDRATQQEKPKTSSSTDLTPDEQNALVQATMRKNNPLAPSLITFRGPRAKTMAQALLKNPDYDPQKAEAGLAGARAGAGAAARLTEAGAPQLLSRAANSADAFMDKFLDISNEFGRTNVQFLNEPYLKIAKQSGGKAQKFASAVVETRMAIASVLAAGIGSKSPGESEEAEAKKMLPDSITPAQAIALVPQQKEFLKLKVDNMMRRVGPTGEMPKASKKELTKGAPTKDAPHDPRQLIVVRTRGGKEFTIRRGSLEAAQARSPGLKVIGE